MRKKIFFLITVLTILVMFTSISQASETNTKDEILSYDYAPVIGDFVPDPELEKIVELKIEVAKKYAEALKNGDLDTARQIMQEHNTLFPENTVIKPLKGIHDKEQAMEHTDSEIMQTTSRRLPIYQVPQETTFWCGYAAIKSLLDYGGVDLTQREIAKIVYNVEKPCPWYISHGDDRSQFPVATNLHKWTGYYYVPIPYGRAGANPIDTNLVESSVIYTINKKYGVLAAGNSTGKKDYTLPGYPTDENINHWIAIDGYDNNGKTIWIVDPAKSDVIRWSKNIKKYYDIPSTLLRNYVSTRGLIW